MTHDVFLSHSHKDKLVADATCAMLESVGIRCWIAPRDIEPGQPWAAAIIRGIESCKVILVLLSSHSNISGQVHREVERALNRGLAILPVRLEDMVLDPSLEFFIGTVHRLDALPSPFQQHLHRIVPAVQALLKYVTANRSTMPQDLSRAIRAAPPARDGRQLPILFNKVFTATMKWDGRIKACARVETNDGRVVCIDADDTAFLETTESGVTTYKLLDLTKDDPFNATFKAIIARMRARKTK